mgnify:CR=1 FL=1
MYLEVEQFINKIELYYYLSKDHLTLEELNFIERILYEAYEYGYKEGYSVGYDLGHADGRHEVYKKSIGEEE